MTNGNFLPEKNESFENKINKLSKQILQSSKKIDELSYKLTGQKIKSKTKLKSVTSNNPRNKSGTDGEISVRKILNDIIKESNFTMIEQRRVYPPFDLKDAFEKNYIQSDTLIINNYNENELFLEIKNQQSAGSVSDGINERSRQYAMLKKPVLFVVSGEYFSDALINKKNKTWKFRNESDYVMMINQEDLKLFLEIWTNHVFTNFEHIRLIMNHKKEQSKEILIAA